MGGRDINADWEDVAHELDELANVQDMSGKIIGRDDTDDTRLQAAEAARYRAAHVLRKEAARLREDSA